MLHKFLLFCVIGFFSSFILKIINIMIRDNSAMIRFIGYLVAIVIAIFVLFIILYYFFNINLIRIIL